jgi:nucleotide-binding universal stress UspA family protein
MQQFKKLGVFLHNSPADDAALAYAGMIATRADSESVLCIHVGEADDAGPTPDPAAFEAAVRGKLPPAAAAITRVEVHSAAGVPEILRAARDMSLDLIVVGRRLPSEQIGIGSAFARLARKAPCNVLVVPTHSHPHLERLFVPVDFSEHSRRALALAVEIARGSGAAQPQLVVHTNFTVGYGYAKLGLSLPQAVTQREQTAREQMQEFRAGRDSHPGGGGGPQDGPDRDRQPRQGPDVPARLDDGAAAAPGCAARADRQREGRDAEHPGRPVRRGLRRRDPSTALRANCETKGRGMGIAGHGAGSAGQHYHHHPGIG